ADGYCTAEDIDIGIREGLAVRWSIIGPFETGDLNAPQGIRDYVDRYQHIYVDLHEAQKRRVDWDGPVLDQIEAERRDRLPADQLAARQAWRDRQLMALARHRRAARERLGD
ncbi:MAG: 3-hydroxyacyl-CoA dehydrogenase, partial [Pseudomonadota bacterium]